MERDLEKNPYSEDEQRVADFLVAQTGIGAGDDPIGFLLASYTFLVNERNDLLKKLKAQMAE